MIELIYADQGRVFPDVMDAMHRLRYDVFKERMDWDVQTKNGQEFDSFDHLNPAYLIYRAEDGDVDGCLRLLPSTGPYMLKDTFPQLLSDQSAPVSKTIWESSRFAVNTEKGKGTGKGKVNLATAELLCGILEFGLANNLTEVVSVFDLLMERVLKRAGCPTKRIGKPMRIGKTIAVAGLFEISETALLAAREAGGIKGPVLRSYAWPNIPKTA